MANEDLGLSSEKRKFLIHEYEVVSESWRFLTGLRFALLAFAATMLSALIASYQFVLVNLDNLGDLGYTALWAVPVFGIITMIAVILIEWRTRKLYFSCLQRGQEIEKDLDVVMGHFGKIWNAPLPLGIASHTVAIIVIYGIILFTWGYLAYKALTH